MLTINNNNSKSLQLQNNALRPRNLLNIRNFIKNHLWDLNNFIQQ